MLFHVRVVYIFISSGIPQNAGILPRALDLLFNSLPSNLKAMKFIFKPDGQNGYNVNTQAGAMLDRQVQACFFPLLLSLLLLFRNVRFNIYPAGKRLHLVSLWGKNPNRSNLQCVSGVRWGWMLALY